ncbi:glycosyltransferase [Phycicoccus sp.]|uniref:glycosyltransferase n=1 Tax=Phycicoccus sp. TaxID=1902410 RepID=UPI002B540908|nr:glycosyltransferase [Phycicoccus sp.]HMM95715.1 glycosyltransferase [Phycicoccus sp.]
MSSADGVDPAPESAFTRKRRVVMMVGNDIAHDTRVLKMGLTLADAGVDVTLLGYASSGVREERAFGKVRILRVPVEWRLRKAFTKARDRRRQPRLGIGMRPTARRTLDLTASLRRQEADALGTRTTGLRAREVAAEQFAARIRAGVDRRTARLERKAWRVYDGLQSRNGHLASWRRLLPQIDDYEIAFGPVLDHLEWDVLHAHDVHLIGVASRAVARRRAEGRSAAWVYDAHEYVAGLSIYGSRTVRQRAAYLDLESEYIHDADVVVTVTQPLAEQLRDDYGLEKTPAVVMNSPMLGAADLQVPRTLREQVGLAPEVPLVVYSGGVTPVRGVATAVEALVHLPEVHLAVVAVPNVRMPAAERLAARASELGVAGRVHLLDPVPPDEVSAYLRGCDVGLLPIHHYGSHEVALANKLFEYLHAGVPLLVSDCRAQEAFVHEHGVGRVHVADDVGSFVTELRALLTDLPRYRAVVAADADLLAPFAWDRQEAVLREVYRGLLGAEHVHEPIEVTPLEGLRERPAERTDRASYVGIGPANMAGQAWEWAKALERNIPGVRTEVVATDRGGPLTFPADQLVPTDRYAKDWAWAAGFQARALETWTHALLEAGRPVFGLRNGRDFTGDADVLRAVGVRVGLILHGSEIRNPARHAHWTPWSPFRNSRDELTVRLQGVVDSLAPLIEDFPDPVFVSTPDLLLDVPRAQWLPVVVDVDAWSADTPVLERDRPVVLHAPSRASLKGTAFVDAALSTLHDEGVVDYRRIEKVAPEAMPGLIAAADIVLDQFAIGSYGVLAVQALAAGRVVVGHVMPEVREAVGELPITEAAPDTLEEVLRDLLADRDGARAQAAAGVSFVRETHDGRRAAQVLHEVLGVRGDAPGPP